MTISLVTGGNGYFGSLLVDRLLNEGHHVRVLDISLSTDRRADIEYIQGDIRNQSVVQQVVQKADFVFNNVAQVPLAKDRSLLRTVNIDGTKILLDSCLLAGVQKVVHTSSSAIFGVPTSNPVFPDTPALPLEAYGQAKWEAEILCTQAIANGLDVSIIRPRTILGHGRLGIFGILFDWIADGADPFVLGNGNNRYQFIHAEDLADICWRASQSLGPNIFNAGTDRFGTMREALEELCLHAGTGSRVRSLPARPTSLAMQVAAKLHIAPFAPYHWIMYSKSMWFDVTHAHDILDWSPRWSNSDMFKQSYDWFLQNRAESNNADASHHRRTARQGALGLVKRATKLLPR